jgi:hypothetical protein
MPDRLEALADIMGGVALVFLGATVLILAVLVERSL